MQRLSSLAANFRLLCQNIVYRFIWSKQTTTKSGSEFHHQSVNDYQVASRLHSLSISLLVLQLHLKLFKSAGKISSDDVGGLNTSSRYWMLGLPPPLAGAFWTFHLYRKSIAVKSSWVLYTKFYSPTNQRR